MLGIIMAGGQGSRLRPITNVRPKPMVEVLGRPVIDFVKDSMVLGGVDNIIVTTGYRGEMLAEHVKEWNAETALLALIKNPRPWVLLEAFDCCWTRLLKP